MALSRQDFESASTPVDRWRMRFPVSDLDERGAYIHPRPLIPQSAHLCGCAPRGRTSRLSGPETHDKGVVVIGAARETAAAHGLRHQLDSITRICAERAVN